MKSIVKTVMLFALIFTACKKNAGDNPQSKAPVKETKMLASKTSLKTGESLFLYIIMPDTAAGVNVAAKWSVTPGTGVTIDSLYSFSENSITFSQAGTYTVNADLRKVQCSPEAAAHPGMDTCYNGGSDFTAVSNTITIHD